MRRVNFKWLCGRGTTHARDAILAKRLSDMELSAFSDFEMYAIIGGIQIMPGIPRGLEEPEMGDNPEDEIVKKFELELEIFGKKNKPRLKLMEDISLCIGTCKTPQVETSLREMMQKTLAEMQKEMLTTEKRLQTQLEQAAKKAEKENAAAGAAAAKKKKDDAKAAKQTKAKLKITLDKFSRKYMPKDNTLFIEFTGKPKSKPPFVDPKKSFFFIGTTF